MSEQVTCDNCGTTGKRRRMTIAPAGWLFAEFKIDDDDPISRDVLILRACSERCALAVWKKAPGGLTLEDLQASEQHRPARKDTSAFPAFPTSEVRMSESKTPPRAGWWWGKEIGVDANERPVRVEQYDQLLAVGTGGTRIALSRFEWGDECVPTTTLVARVRNLEAVAKLTCRKIRDEARCWSREDGSEFIEQLAVPLERALHADMNLGYVMRTNTDSEVTELQHLRELVADAERMLAGPGRLEAPLLIGLERVIEVRDRCAKESVELERKLARSEVARGSMLEVLLALHDRVSELPEDKREERKKWLEHIIQLGRARDLPPGWTYKGACERRSDGRQAVDENAAWEIEQTEGARVQDARYVGVVDVNGRATLIGGGGSALPPGVSVPLGGGGSALPPGVVARGPMEPEYEPVTEVAKIGYLVEECAEVGIVCGTIGQVCGKLLRFGPEGFNPTLPEAERRINAQLLVDAFKPAEHEIANLLYAIQIVRDLMTRYLGQGQVPP